jgi:hypothetical protein
LKPLDDQARRLERNGADPSLDAFVAAEMSASPDLDGRSVFGWERDLRTTKSRSSGAIDQLLRKSVQFKPD